MTNIKENSAFKQKLKYFVKSILFLSTIKQLRNLKKSKDSLLIYKNLTTKEVFTKIYEEGVWGKSEDPNQKYFSGGGSHDAEIVKPYIESIQKFLSSFEAKPNVVDLGCGDFFIGSKTRSLCASYTACDIVQPLIDFNKEKYRTLNVDFRVLDLTKDELPQADIAFIRQVLQHLSNEQILKAIPQISSKYKYLVLTEHLPSTHDFIENLDKPAGPDIRFDKNSGVVLTSPPFNLAIKKQKQLCQFSLYGGLISTTLYTLK